MPYFFSLWFNSCLDIPSFLAALATFPALVIQKRVMSTSGAWVTELRKCILIKLPLDKIAELFCCDNGRTPRKVAPRRELILQELFSTTGNDICFKYTTDFA
jgi:hypothetical protein